MNVYVKEPAKPAQACVIWLHGLGADYSDMAGLVDQLPVGELALRHVFLDAPIRAVTINQGMSMRAWYDILGMQLTDREDETGILESQASIRQVIDTQLKQGFSSEQIILAGFSQGGAMALFTALHHETPLAGVIALSAYLPLATRAQPVLPKTVPMFIACGQYDPIVFPAWTKQTATWLTSQGYSALTWHEYPMDHSICMAEVHDLSRWLVQQITGDLL